MWHLSYGRLGLPGSGMEVRMKRERIIGIVLAAVNAILLAIGLVLYIRLDRTEPYFEFQAVDFIYEEGMDTARLLEGITAYDNKDGDITDKIVVEKWIESREQDSVVVIYAVSDSAGNVAKCSREFPAIFHPSEEEKEGDGTEVQENWLMQSGFWAGLEGNGTGESKASGNGMAGDADKAEGDGNNGAGAMDEEESPEAPEGGNGETGQIQEENGGTNRDQEGNDRTGQAQEENDGADRRQEGNDGTGRDQGENNGTNREREGNDGTGRDQGENNGTNRDREGNDRTGQAQEEENGGTGQEEEEDSGFAREQPERSHGIPDPEAPILTLKVSEVKTSVGMGPAWVNVIGTLSDDKDSYETLFHNLEVSKYDKNQAGTYQVAVSTKDSDGNRSEAVPLTIIVK